MKFAPWLAAGVLAAATLAAVPALASPAVTPAPSVKVHGMRAAHVQIPSEVLPSLKPAAVVQSSNWSGYAALPVKGQTMRYVAADFTIPSVVCGTLGNSGDAVDSTWVGLDGYSDTTVEQTGTDAICSGGTPAYYAWYEMYPLAPVLFTGVSPGDAIVVSVLHTTGSTYALSLTDVTTGSVIDTTQACPAGSTCRNESAEVISEVTGGGPPVVDLPNFGMTNFIGTGVTTTSVHRGPISAGPYWTSSEIVMEDSSNADHLMSQPDTLWGGRAFSTTWKASS